MNEYCRKLEVALGPDTADLAFRIGLHSGAVTAGVLRGQNARFQLFGDTMVSHRFAGGLALQHLRSASYHS
jgi:hypothetical protein